MTLLPPFRWWQRLCEAAGLALGLVMIVVVVYQVIARYSPVPLAPWTEEAARFLFIWTTALIAGPAYHRGAYVGVDLVPSLLPDRVFAIWARVIHVLVIAFAVILMLKGFELGQRTMNQSTPGLGITMGYINGAMGFAGLNIIIMGVGTFLRTQSRPRYGETLESAEAMAAAGTREAASGDAGSMDTDRDRN